MNYWDCSDEELCDELVDLHAAAVRTTDWEDAFVADLPGKCEKYDGLTLAQREKAIELCERWA